ncbi:MAG: NAD-dependent deacylase [Desulfarculus sp.]|nr:NAD-dependent deacylase [Desulfarculus sp.]
MKGHELQSQLREVAELICAADQVVALTGAGISVESGIPAFRGAQGLWEKYDPMEFAAIDSFLADPARVWKMLLELDHLVRQAQPNPAHDALAKLEKMGKLSAVITQNIDGLHQAAGNRNVIEFHGSGRRLRCLSCGRQISRLEVIMDPLPPRCACGGLVKPDIVFFGEPIPERAAMTAFTLANSCQVMLVIGTSAVVAPASHLPLLAKSGGAKVVEVNLEPTALSQRVSDYVFHFGAGDLMTWLTQVVEDLMEERGEQAG